MSALGQKRTFRSVIVMSALPPKADICSAHWPTTGQIASMINGAIK